MEDTRKTDAQGEDAGKRDEEATSNETLSDIEENEKVSTGSSSGSDSSSSLEGSSPKPDSGGEGSADGSETGGPM